MTFGSLTTNIEGAGHGSLAPGSYATEATEGSRDEAYYFGGVGV